MLNKRIEEELNKQINAEFYSAYLYLSMSSYLYSNNLAGFGNWMRVQFEEEQMHALKMVDYVTNRGGNVVLEAIKQPKKKWKNVIDVFEETLAHEQEVTKMINNLMSVAIEEKDHATASLMQWFVDEQVEEEATASEIVDQLKLVEGKGSGLFLLDRDAKTRVINTGAAE